MNFTREPIIETIISPREGHKLLVRNSKGGGGEEYYVDAAEVVSFGSAFFFRSLERPKAFLVPVSDYEILEVKEARVALKNVSHERSIKIGGGREASLRQSPREVAHVKEAEPIVAAAESQPVAEETVLESAIGARMDKRRDRRRHRRRRGGEEQEWSGKKGREGQEQRSAVEPTEEGSGGTEDEAKAPSPMFSSLIPPPTTLISQTLSRYKEAIPAEEVKKEKEEEKKKPSPDQEEGGAESIPLNRISASSTVQSIEESSFSSTFFTSLSGNNDPFFF